MCCHRNIGDVRTLRELQPAYRGLDDGLLHKRIIVEGTSGVGGRHDELLVVPTCAHHPNLEADWTMGDLQKVIPLHTRPSG
jgi:hypothetical protein